MPENTGKWLSVRFVFGSIAHNQIELSNVIIRAVKVGRHAIE
jgi:hypothetical protein